MRYAVAHTPQQRFLWLAGLVGCFSLSCSGSEKKTSDVSFFACDDCCVLFNGVFRYFHFVSPGVLLEVSAIILEVYDRSSRVYRGSCRPPGVPDVVWIAPLNQRGPPRFCLACLSVLSIDLLLLFFGEVVVRASPSYLLNAFDI